MAKTKNKIKTLLNKLYQGLYEREEAVRLALLAALAGESIFLLGRPGLAKSLVARRLKFAFSKVKSFEYLMSRFSTPDEVFGPVSIKQLKEEDRYIRLTENYLPGAQIVFLDEIWKAGAPIQNALLTVLNEKIYRNGDTEVKVDLRALISASNELPAKNKRQEALWDRFLIRLELSNIQDEDSFQDMLEDTKDPYLDIVEENEKITTQEYQKWSEKISNISIPVDVSYIIVKIRKEIVKWNAKKKAKKVLIISDRRWKKIIRLLQTSAFANDRKNVDLMDCFLIPHCLWDTPEQFPELFQMVQSIIERNGYEIGYPLEYDIEQSEELDADAEAFDELEADVKKFDKEVKDKTSFKKTIKRKVKKEDDEECYKIKGKIMAGIHNCCLIQKTTFAELRKKRQGEIELYYERTPLLNTPYFDRCRTFPAKYISDTQISVKNKIYNLELEEVETVEKFSQKTNSTLHPKWRKMAVSLSKRCQTLLKKVENYRKKEQTNANNNLFVPKELAKFVFARLDRMMLKINDLQVEIEKIRHHYETL